MNSDHNPDLEKIGIKTGKKAKVKIKKIIFTVKEPKQEPPREPKIIEEQPKTLWDVCSDDLYNENKHCKKKKWEVYSKRFVPWSLSICGLVCSAYIVLFVVMPNMFHLSHTDWYWIFGVIFTFSLLPVIWLTSVRNRDDKLLAYYRERIELITHILRIRGDL